jgi:hypothetical protein
MTEDYWEWRYFAQGRVAHALSRSGSMKLSRVAKCGAEPWLISGDWCGTGSQREYERAAELPRCKKCLRKIESLR